MKIKEGVNADEYLITRHSNFKTPLNLINVYGEQESRVSTTEVQDRWGTILEDIHRVERRNEAIILLGDLNKQVGCDYLGVRDNQAKISTGGNLLRALLDTGDYVCLNNSEKREGGPFTRFEPSCPGDITKQSCLDLVIVSKRLVPYVESILIDSKKEFSPIRPISKTKSVTSDHFPIIVTFRNLPTEATKKPPIEKYTMWNTNKVGGLEEYENLTRKDDLFKNIVNFSKEYRHEKSMHEARHEKSRKQDSMDTPHASSTETMNKINKVMTKVKHTAFGKVKIRKVKNKENKVANEETNQNIIEKLLEEQRLDVEKEFEYINNLKMTKGKTAAVFRTFDKIKGKSKDGPELVTMKDPETNHFIFSPDEIKKTSLKYCVSLLNNRKIDPAFEKEIEFENLIHYFRMKKALNVDEEDDFSRKDFDKRLKKLKANSKDKYKFMLKSGEGFKTCIFSLFEQVWEEEVKPQQWRNTVIIQLYKGKGEAFDFNNQRNIHTKEDTPKLFEGIVVDWGRNDCCRSVW